MTGLGYTVPALLAVLAVCGWELLFLRTGLFRRPAYWLSMLIVLGFQVPVDGWLTKLSAPVVEYAPRQVTGLRGPWDIPVEDFLFGFALVTAALLLWERQERPDHAGRGTRRAAPRPGRRPAAGAADRTAMSAEPAGPPSVRVRAVTTLAAVDEPEENGRRPPAPGAAAGRRPAAAAMAPAFASAWTAGQVAQHLGIPESTLRTWHRRYGLGPHDAEPGHYRRYRQEDVARLRRMLELINLGMLASDAARMVQAGEAASVHPERDVADLVAAARALDTERCGAVLDGLLARRGVVDAWELAGCPALLAVDADQRADPACMDVEHALSWALLAALNRLPKPPPAAGTPSILLACAEGEQHTLPLVALSAALAERRVPSRMLGAATPTVSLVRAAREARPDAVVLWAQRAETASPDALSALRRHPVRRIAAGPGWGARALPGVVRVTTLREALTAVAGVPGPSSRAVDANV